MSAPTVDPVEDGSVSRHPVRLQERRGSNLSLLLDVSSVGAEPVCSVSTPKEVWLQLLHTSSRLLTHTLLQQAAMDTHTLNAEYQNIPPNFVMSAELDIPGHSTKDRYKSILPNPDSRVVLRSLQEEAGPDRYINANYIRGHGGSHAAYIATQGPMVHTLADFWDMVWQERSTIIVMVTRLKENNEKCEQYWPAPKQGGGVEDEEEEDEEEEAGEKGRGEEGRFGRYQLRVTDRREGEGIIITDMEIQLGSECRPVRHYWFTSWPDHHIPQCTAPLLRLVEEVDIYSKSLPPTGSQPITTSVLKSGPIIVHCSAGVGRTGGFIASSIGCQQLRDSGQVDILEIVCQLRLDRGGMIQTPEQYHFLYNMLAQYSRHLQHSHNHQRGTEQNQNQNQTNTLAGPQTRTEHLGNSGDLVLLQLDLQNLNLELDNTQTVRK